MQKFLSVAVVLFGSFLLLTADHANAAIITYNFSGTVTDNPPATSLAGTFAFGESYSGTISFDTSVADSNGSPTNGEYDGALTSINVNIGSYAASATGGKIEVEEASFFDSFDAEAKNAAPLFGGSATVTGASVGGLSLGGIQFLLLDTTKSVFSSDAMPLSLSLGDFNVAIVSLLFYDASQPVTSAITSLALSLDTLTLEETSIAVPAPGAPLILGCALAGLGFARRQRLKARR